MKSEDERENENLQFKKISNRIKNQIKQESINGLHWYEPLKAGAF
nr:hypothetical protein [Mycoplasmopsis bovis]